MNIEGGVTDHRDHEDNEGEARQPQVPEGTVPQLARPLGGGLERDHTAEELGCDCSPARLYTTTTLTLSLCMLNRTGTDCVITSLQVEQNRNRLHNNKLMPPFCCCGSRGCHCSTSEASKHAYEAVSCVCNSSAAKLMTHIHSSRLGSHS